MKNEGYYQVCPQFENIPSFMQGVMWNAFVDHRNEVVEVINELIDEVNKQWDLTGKPAAFGDYVEDVNPEYVEFMRTKIQPRIDVLNKSFKLCKYCIDDIGDIVEYIPWIPKSKIYFTLKGVGP